MIISLQCNVALGLFEYWHSPLDMHRPANTDVDQEYSVLACRSSNRQMCPATPKKLLNDTKKTEALIRPANSLDPNMIKHLWDVPWRPRPLTHRFQGIQYKPSARQHGTSQGLAYGRCLHPSPMADSHRLLFSNHRNIVF